MTADTDNTLSKLGREAETLLAAQLKDMERDLKKPKKEDRQYTLLDRLKVIDRIAKFEAIRAKMSDEEGSYFNGRKGADDGNG